MIKQNVCVLSNPCDEICKINLVAHKQNVLNSNSSVPIAPHFYSECKYSALFHLDIICKQLAIMQK